jgi:hypothetical protein
MAGPSSIITSPTVLIIDPRGLACDGPPLPDEWRKELAWTGEATPEEKKQSWRKK